MKSTLVSITSNRIVSFKGNIINVQDKMTYKNNSTCIYEKMVDTKKNYLHETKQARMFALFFAEFLIQYPNCSAMGENGRTEFQKTEEGKR